ncbi:hypothetical protein CONPUDRAFT_84057 [Coniophora puteana RWD-64-598 SS2]|uniref:Peptidase M48 domain-containing protein n=1 Tax=Coniophora puteana (strain RWD-64-598) TaxID=741705 RepID=A0A5M3MEG7_CONPW|nr:uncharacterized protein CONPUDRAFT_84057 [Coniophora puteana RWD-64-598 SS2]EIW77622.1 hypothetical protein CONPUDRAFT_84057 [Coniophora puteana RWD-64-598 SS2]
MLPRILIRTAAARSLPRGSPLLGISSRLPAPSTPTLPSRSLPLLSTLPPTHTASSTLYVRRISTSSPRRQQYYVRFGDPTPKRGGSGWNFGRKDPNGKLDTRTKVVLYVAAGGVAYYVVHLEQVPETGRWRFMDISPKYEAKLAKEARAQLLAEFHNKTLPPNHPITRHVHRVASAILEANGLGTLEHDSAAGTGTSSSPFGRIFGGGQNDERGNYGAGAEGGFGQGGEGVWSSGHTGDDGFAGGKGPGGAGRNKKWNLIVVNDRNVVNAMVTFGNIVVFTGILPICKDEQGLAAVLGHEIGHEVARHGPERYSSSKVLIFFAFALQTLGVDLGISNLLTTLLLELPNSRAQETEADTIGVRLAAKACYPGEAAVAMHERLGRHEKANLGGAGGFEFLRTHPTSETRMRHLESMIAEANDIRAASPLCANTSEVFGRFRDALGFAGSSLAHGSEPEMVRRWM